MNIKEAQDLVKYAYEKIWWMDVLYPFILSGILFCGLSYLIYHGEKHRSISGQVEAKFISFSLRTASPRPLRRQNKVVTVTLQDSDLIHLESYQYRGHRDASVSEYAEIVRKLYAAGAKYVAVNWMHGPVNIDEYKGLLQVLQDLPKDKKLVFGVLPILQGYVPKELRELTDIMESDPCQTDTQLICNYQSHWEDWIIQDIVRYSWMGKSDEKEKQYISKNLPRNFPGYLLYFSDQSFIRDFSYLEVKNLSFPKHFFRDKMIFVGNGLNPKKQGLYKQIGRVRMPFVSKDGGGVNSGTPYHKYWAQIAQLFIDDALINVVPSWLSVSIAIIFAIGIILCLAYLGGPFTLVVFLCLVVLLPFLNVLTLRFFSLYLPIFDTIYACFSTFFLVVFIRISIESFQTWRWNMRLKEDEEVADVKGNFISLISHNLNTPVAKMQGMLNILKSMPMEEKLDRNLNLACALVARIQLSIKAVLVSTAIDDGKLIHEPLNLQAILKEFRTAVLPPLKRFGFQVSVKIKMTYEELTLLPMYFDKRVLINSIGSLALLFRSREEGLTLDIGLIVQELVSSKNRLGSENFVITASCKDAWISKRIYTALQQKEPLEEHTVISDTSLLEDVSVNLILGVINIYNGSIKIKKDRDAKGGTLEMSIFPKKGRY